MSPARLARRALVVVSAGALVATGLLVAPAFADPAAITSVTPGSASNDSPSATTLTFHAESPTFTPGATVTLTGPLVGGTAYTVTNSGLTTKSLTTNDLSGSFALNGAAPGDYAVSIKNLGSSTPDYTCAAGCFKVTNPTPTVTGIARSSGNAPSATAFTITGTGFAAGTAVAIQQAGLAASNINWTTTSQTATTLVGTLTIGTSSSAPVGGAYDIVVTNTDTKHGGCTGCFVVPKSTSLDRTNLAYGAQSKTIHVTGVGFTAATKATFLPPSGTNLVTVNSTTFISPTEIDLVVTVADPAAASALSTVDYDLVTTDKGDGYFKKLAALTLDPRPTPSTTPYNFDNPGAASTLTEIITGNGFQSDMTVAFTDPTGIAVGTVVVNPAGTTATFPITLAADVALTDRTLTLTNPDDFGVNLPGAKTLKPSAKPAVSSVTPAAVSKGSPPVALTVHGTGIGRQAISSNGATASTGTNYVTPQMTLLDPLTHDPVGSAANATAASDGLSSTATLSVPATSGTYDVEYRDHNGSTVVCTGCFNVDDLSVTGITPNTDTNDTSYAFTIAGACP